ncbi:MAG TPA: hypothetical protein HA326_06365 [Thermoplasmata archaeon]|nr:hypothetical protein [Thermoplasmata archaeon]
MAASVATTTAAENVAPDAEAFGTSVSLASQFRHFLWLSSGMFSMSALFFAFLDYWTLGPQEQAATHFVAAVVAAALFGVATLLKFGPDVA